MNNGMNGINENNVKNALDDSCAIFYCIPFMMRISQGYCCPYSYEYRDDKIYLILLTPFIDIFCYLISGFFLGFIFLLLIVLFLVLLAIIIFLCIITVITLGLPICIITHYKRDLICEKIKSIKNNIQQVSV